MLDRMLTTKYPLGVVLMELAHQMRRRRLVLRAKWLPRLENEEADALTNLDFRHFSAERRVPVDLDKMDFGVLPDLFSSGEQYLKELEDARAKVKTKAAQELSREGGTLRDGKRAKRAGEKLRDREPW